MYNINVNYCWYYKCTFFSNYMYIGIFINLFLDLLLLVSIIFLPDSPDTENQPAIT